jgi:hypothetical protein
MTDQKSSAATADFFRLCALLEKKIAVFKDFMSLTILLKNMIREHNVEAVEIMIAQRQDHIVLINRIDDEIHMIRKTNPHYEAMLNPEMRKRIQSLLKMVENCINKTMRLNRDCETAAEDELHKLGNGLSRLGQRGQSFKGYVGKSREPRFLDVMT